MTRVIAGFDGSPGSRVALIWAAEESRLRGLPLRVLTLLDDDSDLGSLRDDLAPVVSELVADVDAGPPADYEVLRGSAKAGLIDAATAEDLLVVGSRGRSALAGLMLGSVSHACLCAAPGPVVIVPAEAGGARRFGRVIAGVDGSPPARRALAAAAEEARLREAELSAVHAVYWDAIGAELSTPDDAQLISWGGRLVAAELAESGVAAQPQVLAGHPADVLTRESAAADLLVVGSRGHGGLAGIVAGSTADHCARHAHCPVMIIR